jgi:DNA-binding PadR family transcriptional regulator
VAKTRKGDVRAAALLVLQEGPRNGYQLIQEIAARTEGRWRPSSGSVYPALAQLEDEGLIRQETADGRRAYALTPAGEQYVAGHREELGQPWESYAEPSPDPYSGLRDLVGQVGAAAMQVVQAGTQDQVDEARRLLIRTRQQLYRILADGSPDHT